MPTGSNDVACSKRSLLGARTGGVIALNVTRIPRNHRIFAHVDIRRGLRVNTFDLGSRSYLNGSLRVIFSCFPHLGRHHHRLTNALSNNRRRVITVKHTLVDRPGAVLVSRPSVNLSPLLIGKVFSVVIALHRHNVAILLIRRGTEVTLSVTSHTCILRANGVAVRNGTSSLLRSRGIHGTCLNTWHLTIPVFPLASIICGHLEHLLRSSMHRQRR